MLSHLLGHEYCVGFTQYHNGGSVPTVGRWFGKPSNLNVSCDEIDWMVIPVMSLRLLDGRRNKCADRLAPTEIYILGH
ncbi:hypothetical protein OK016_17135 [Vibrio chagasii]|nr:hypothetical protein [Vibrio chagasii]